MKFINADDPSILLADPFNVQSIYIWDYCGFNPVAYVDVNGYKWYTKLSEYKKRWNYTKFLYNNISRNYNTNKRVFSGYQNSIIFNQNNYPTNSMKYGNYYLSYNGCEIIAVYNALKLMGYKPYLPQIILEFEINHMYYLTNTGKFGTDPEDLCDYFKAHNIKYSYSTSAKKFLNFSNSGRKNCGIFSFWNNTKDKHPFDFISKGLHTVAYKYNYKNHYYYIYNLESNCKSYKKMIKKQLEAYLNNRRFIVGYWL